MGGAEWAFAKSAPECIWVTEWDIEQPGFFQQVLKHPIPKKVKHKLELAKSCGNAGLAAERKNVKKTGVSWKDYVGSEVLEMRRGFIVAARHERHLLTRVSNQCRNDSSDISSGKTDIGVLEAQDVVYACGGLVSLIGDLSSDRRMGGETPVVGSAKSPWLNDINLSDAEAVQLLKEARFELEAAKVIELRAMHQKQIAKIGALHKECMAGSTAITIEDVESDSPKFAVFETAFRACSSFQNAFPTYAEWRAENSTRNGFDVEGDARISGLADTVGSHYAKLSEKRAQIEVQKEKSALILKEFEPCRAAYVAATTRKAIHNKNPYDSYLSDDCCDRAVYLDKKTCKFEYADCPKLPEAPKRPSGRDRKNKKKKAAYDRLVKEQREIRQDIWQCNDQKFRLVENGLKYCEKALLIESIPIELKEEGEKYKRFFEARDAKKPSLAERSRAGEKLRQKYLRALRACTAKCNKRNVEWVCTGPRYFKRNPKEPVDPTGRTWVSTSVLDTAYSTAWGIFGRYRKSQWSERVLQQCVKPISFPDKCECVPKNRPDWCVKYERR